MVAAYCIWGTDDYVLHLDADSSSGCCAVGHGILGAVLHSWSGAGVDAVGRMVPRPGSPCGYRVRSTAGARSQDG